MSSKRVFTASLFLTLLSSSLLAQIAVRGKIIHTMVGPPIKDGIVILEKGKIAAIGKANGIRIPDGYKVLKAKVVTPGLIDAHSVVGLAGMFNYNHDQDQLETSAPIQPELRAVDAYNTREELIDWVRGFGVTTLNAGPSPGQPVSGRTLVVRTIPAPVDQIALVPDGPVVMSLSEGSRHRFGDQGAASRMGSAATIRQALVAAQEYRERRRLPLADRPPRNLGDDVLVELLDGQRRALVHAHRADDLLTALRIAVEFGLDVVLAGASEGYLVRDALAAAGVEVLVGPVMIRSPWFSGETRLASWENAALLADAGVPIGFTSGFEGYVPKVRVVLWEAAVAASFGLGPERALEALTLGGARILGLDDRIGTLEPGRRADIAVFDGDPFEYTSHVCAVLVGGDVVSRTCR